MPSSQYHAGSCASQVRWGSHPKILPGTTGDLLLGRAEVPHRKVIDIWESWLSLNDIQARFAASCWCALALSRIIGVPGSAVLFLGLSVLRHHFLNEVLGVLHAS
jgi:hypothetical protein